MTKNVQDSENRSICLNSVEFKKCLSPLATQVYFLSWKELNSVFYVFYVCCSLALVSAGVPALRWVFCLRSDENKVPSVVGMREL